MDGLLRSDIDMEEDTDDEGGLEGLEVEEAQPKQGSPNLDADNMLAQMEARLARVSQVREGWRLRMVQRSELIYQSRRAQTEVVPVDETKHASAADLSVVLDADGIGNGWKRLDSTCWRPCPIGCWGSTPAATATATATTSK